MYGIWDNNGLADSPDNAPFEIPLQGLGLFAVRRTAWLRFPDAFRGFCGASGHLPAPFPQTPARPPRPPLLPSTSLFRSLAAIH